MELQRRGIPTVTVVTSEFVPLAKFHAKGRGCPETPLVVVPHPFETLPEEEIRRIADDKFDQLIASLTAKNAGTSPTSGNRSASGGPILVDDSLDAANDLALEKGWTDGLPIVPPTVAKVEKMIASANRLPDDVVAELLPKGAPATTEKIAANAVMAGCIPEYFPVIVAAVEAIAEPEFSLFRVDSTTNSPAAMLMVNGPIRREIGIDCGYGVFGPGWRANATIGRAVRLVQLNIGGAIPGLVSKSTHGQPGRYTMCIGENEEESPWEPLHVERGFQPTDSAVTVFAANGTLNVSDVAHKRAKDILANMISMVDCAAVQTLRYHSGQVLLVLNPVHAHIMKKDGLSKKDVKEFLYELTSRIPLSRFIEDVQQKFIDEGRAANGAISLAPSPGHFIVLVAGGAGGLHATLVPGMAGSLSVTKRLAGRRS